MFFLVANKKCTWEGKSGNDNANNIFQSQFFPAESCLSNLTMCFSLNSIVAVILLIGTLGIQPLFYPVVEWLQLQNLLATLLLLSCQSQFFVCQNISQCCLLSKKVFKECTIKSCKFGAWEGALIEIVLQKAFWTNLFNVFWLPIKCTWKGRSGNDHACQI